MEISAFLYRIFHFECTAAMSKILSFFASRLSHKRMFILQFNLSLERKKVLESRVNNEAQLLREN
jgi:hypothetical protein